LSVSRTISPFNVESLYTVWIVSFCPAQLSGGAIGSKLEPTSSLLQEVRVCH